MNETEIISKVTSWLNNNMDMSCTTDEVRVFCQPNSLISQSMYESQKTFMREVPRLIEIFYGKTDSEEITQKTKSLWREVERKIKAISEKEISIVIERIIDGKTETGKFWNISEILQVFKTVERCRKNAREKYFSLIKIQNQSDDDSRKAHNYLQQALRKFNNNQILNVYEKSVIGQFYEEKIPNSAEIRLSAEMNLDQKIKELKERREAREKTNPLGIGFADLSEFPDEPMFWNLNLLTYNYFFEAIQR